MRERDIIKTLADELARPLGRSSREIRNAWRAGLEAQAGFEQRCQEEGAKILADATAKNEKMILLVGRPYNNYDGGANLGLPQKIADMGRTVLPIDFLEPDLSRLVCAIAMPSGATAKRSWPRWNRRPRASCSTSCISPTSRAGRTASCSASPRRSWDAGRF